MHVQSTPTRPARAGSWLALEAAAVHFSVSTRTVDRWARSGLVERRWIAERPEFLCDDVAEWIPIMTWARTFRSSVATVAADVDNGFLLGLRIGRARLVAPLQLENRPGPGWQFLADLVDREAA
jgi:hypothetical protein